MRFLGVDDSSTMRRIIINTSDRLGPQDCQEAGSGNKGLERLDAGPVDRGLFKSSHKARRVWKARQS
jgi:hypothetical protein